MKKKNTVTNKNQIKQETQDLAYIDELLDQPVLNEKYKGITLRQATERILRKGNDGKESSKSE